jgi:uncharacterized membrane protein YoaK (UPF0700 family)
MRRLLLLTGPHRTPAINRMLGGVLAFNAGALNAGGFLALHMYTSHMSGFASMLADNLFDGNPALLLAALGALLSFVSGAGVAAILINWGWQHRLRSAFALPLLMEAVLILAFGVTGDATLRRSTPFAVPFTVLLLAFTMGLQNAMAAKLSRGQIRTTHVTGTVTDLGIELGKMLYWNRMGTPPESRVRANRLKLRLHGILLGMFVMGGVVGAAGFRKVGFGWVIPLALLLLLLCLPPMLHDLRRIAMRRWSAARQQPGIRR